MNAEIKFGSTRTVLLIGSYALKIPSFAEYRLFLCGLLANLQEVQFSKTGWPQLCPVTFRLPLGIMVVMKRCEPLTDSQWDAFDSKAFIEKENYVLPVEDKRDSFGRLNGKIVAVDYGS